MKKGLKIGLIVGGSVIGTALIALVTIALIMTNSFKDSISEFVASAESSQAYKAYESDYNTLRDDAVSASDSYKFWSYSDYEEQFDDFLVKTKNAQDKTDKYLGKLSEYTEKFRKLFSLGKYKDEIDSTVAKAEKYGSGFQLDRYDSALSELEKLLTDATEMNHRIAGYVSKFKEYNGKYESGKYILGDYADDFKSAKEAVQTAINNFDEKQAASAVSRFAEVVDAIIKNTDETIASYKEQVQSLINYADSRGYSDFDRYKIGEFSDAFYKALNNEDYGLMETNYNELDSWVEKTERALEYNGTGNSLRWVQTDVSDDDSVKLYLSSPEDDSYTLKLEDFIIYEKDGEVWDERKAIDLSQIRGSMSMDLVVDVSSSMWADFYPMQCAVESFINSTSSDTILGLSTIGTIYERFQHMTNNKQAIKNSLWSLTCDGLTSLYQSLYSSVVYTASQTGSRCVVAFTDGDNVPYGTGYDYSAQDVIDVSLYYQVPVYIIGIGNDVVSRTLRNIAESTGGMYFENIGVGELANVYAQIYENLGKLYALTYLTDIANNVTRTVYLRYNDFDAGIHAEICDDLEAQTLQDAYQSAGIDGSDVLSYYSETSYLSTDDLLKLGDSLEKVQTIINIYFARFGYKFNNESTFNQMVSLGVIKSNGSLSNDQAIEKIKKNHICYQNLSALFNFRYELVFKAASQILAGNPGISYEALKDAVHDHFGEPNKNRFSYDVKAAWKALKQ